MDSGVSALKNILYLMADDFRPTLGSYGHPVKTPRLDALAQTALQFDFAYTQFAYCAPSRNSFMSGRRPERTRALNFLTTFRKEHGDAWVTMPQFFKEHGYFTSSAGKIFHDGMDDPLSWSHPSNQTAWIQCGDGDLFHTDNYCGVSAASSTPYTDEDLALAEGLSRMTLAQQSGKPWWVSIGVHRPHTRYRVPDGFYGHQLYPNGTADLVRPPKHPQAPAQAPWLSGNWEGGDIYDGHRRAGFGGGCRECVVPTEHAIEYRRWYYAAVTWADHSLGRALTHLDSFGDDVVSNTIVVFHSDHGYQLGELNEWSKKTNTELATHVPLLVRVPWQPQSRGQRTTVKAELVDLYRTLAVLSGVGEGDVQPDVQGTSLAPLFADPHSPPANLSHKAAYSQIGRCGCGVHACSCGAASPPTCHECGSDACAQVPLGQFDYMGYSMRTAAWRFTAWLPFDNATLRVDWRAGPAATELYDLASDDGRDFDFAGYSDNVAGKAEHAATLRKLLGELEAAVQSWY